MAYLTSPGVSVSVVDTDYFIPELNNHFRIADTGIVDGERWYSVWSSGEVREWIASYDRSCWIAWDVYMVDMNEEMLTVLKLKFSDKEVSNPYMVLIPSKRFSVSE